MLEICYLKAQLNHWNHSYTVEFATNKLVLFLFQMSALKSANKDLKGMMKTVKIQDIDVCLLIMVICFSNLVLLSSSASEFFTADNCDIIM